MKIKTELFAYQRAAYDKLIKLKVGALYMEMGTGKTRTALELVCARLASGKIDKVIWLCPCSVKVNLAHDLDKHVDDWSNTITICGIETLSTSIREIARLKQISTDYKTMLIVDESSLIKNPFALRSEHIVFISRSCIYRLILNGTPISRNEADLFSQWYILDDRILGYKSYYSFARNHLEYDEKTHQIKRALNIGYLTDKIAPYTYQMKKNDCLELPDKTYYTIYCEATNYQSEIYWHLADEYLLLVDEMRPETIYKLFGVLQHCISGIRVREYEGKIKAHEKIFKSPMENPRMQALLDTLHKIGESKVIIFCKYTHEIEEIAEILGDKAVKFYGELSQKKRQNSIESFSKNAQYFIANKSCGAYGLNLQFCSNMIFYSNDWDFATRSQAEDRIHRIGQNNKVTIYDIVTKNTLDERIIKCLTKKENMADAFKRNLSNKINMKEWLNGGEDLHEQNGI